MHENHLIVAGIIATSPLPLSLSSSPAQDVALSRLKHGFESR